MLGITGATVLQVIGLAVSLILFASGLGAALIAATKTRGLAETGQVMATGNAELRAINDDLRDKIEVDKADCDRKLHAQEVDYTAKIANLQGQIDAMTDGLADKIIAAVVRAKGDIDP